MLKALARAHRWKRLLETGEFSSVTELAAAEKINLSHIGRVLRLTLLAPDLVETILDGAAAARATAQGSAEAVVGGVECAAEGGGNLECRGIRHGRRRVCPKGCAPDDREMALVELDHRPPTFVPARGSVPAMIRDRMASGPLWLRWPARY
jgi:hypothetical protein